MYIFISCLLFKLTIYISSTASGLLNLIYFPPLLLLLTGESFEDSRL